MTDAETAPEMVEVTDDDVRAARAILTYTGAEILHDEPRLISRKPDDDCGCPEEYWEAFGLTLHMHLSTKEASNAHADGGDWGEAEMTVRAGSIELDRAAIFGWARQLTTPPSLPGATEPTRG